jgi:retinol dehydrogenase 12
MTMSGKTCLATGATSGIGRETAAGLAALGATMIIVARDAARGEAAAGEIRRRVPDARVETIAADLSSLARVRELAAIVEARHERLDVLVSNAGVISAGRHLTPDGLETTFATNHLGPFLLTNLLLGCWSAALPGGRGGQGQAYPLSKLMNILFTVELARRRLLRQVQACEPSALAQGCPGRGAAMGAQPGALGIGVRTVALQLPFYPGSGGRP